MGAQWIAVRFGLFFHLPLFTSRSFLLILLMVFHREAGSFISSINISVPGTLLDARDRLRTRPTQTLLDTHSPPWQPPAGGPQGPAPLHGVGPLHSSLYLSTSQQHLSLWPSSKVTSIKNFQWLWTLLGLPLAGLWLQSSEPPKLIFILCWGCWSPKNKHEAIPKD